MTNKHKQLIIVGSVLFSLAIVIASQLISSKKTTQSTKQFSIAEIEASDGKDGRDCYVVVDKIVYEIVQGKKWNDGQHDTSKGQAYCGADLTDVIDKSPHGKSILSILSKVGELKQE